MTENDLQQKPNIKLLNNQGFVTLIDYMGSEMTICNAARVSFHKHKPYNSTLTEKDEKLIRYMFNHKHTSPFEHINFTFLISCPLFVRSQWQRHRTWKYNEISRRYTDEDIKFYVPNNIRKQSENNRQASIEHDFGTVVQETIINKINNANKVAYEFYQELLNYGVCREQARGVLPQNLMTEFYATVDLNNLIKFLELRDSEHAQYEIRVYAQAIKKLIMPMFPITMSLIK